MVKYSFTINYKVARLNYVVLKDERCGKTFIYAVLKCIPFKQYGLKRGVLFGEIFIHNQLRRVGNELCSLKRHYDHYDHYD